MSRPVCYVAGAMTVGALHVNVRRAFDAGLALMRAGVAPIVPHGGAFWGCLTGSVCGRPAFIPELSPCSTTHAEWMAVCLPIVGKADAVLRLPGESKGADMETAEAGRLGIPVFTSVAAVAAWARLRKAEARRQGPA